MDTAYLPTFLFQVFILSLLIIAIFRFYHRTFLNYQERVDVKLLLVEQTGKDGEKLVFPSDFGSNKMFDKIELDQTNPKDKKFNMVIKAGFKRISFNLICLSAKNTVLSNQGYEVNPQLASLPCSVRLPKNTNTVVPVLNQIDDEPLIEKNLYSLTQADIFVYSVFQAFSIGLAINLIIRLISNFYFMFPTTCPLCRLALIESLLFIGWVVGIFSFVMIFLMARRVYAKYISAGLNL